MLSCFYMSDLRYLFGFLSIMSSSWLIVAFAKFCSSFAFSTIPFSFSLGLYAYVFIFLTVLIKVLRGPNEFLEDYC